MKKDMLIKISILFIFFQIFQFSQIHLNEYNFDYVAINEDSELQHISNHTFLEEKNILLLSYVTYFHLIIVPLINSILSSYYYIPAIKRREFMLPTFFQSRYFRTTPLIQTKKEIGGTSDMMIIRFIVIPFFTVTALSLLTFQGIEFFHALSDLVKK